MADPEFIMWHGSDGSWWTAPYNDGAGGRFTVDPETQGYFEISAEDSDTDISDEGYFLYLGYEKIIPLKLLPRKSRDFRRHQLLAKINGHWCDCDCGDLSESEKNALCGDDAVVVACTPGDSPSLVWVNQGGRGEWMRDRFERSTAAARREAELKNQSRHDDGAHFINPYTFVPLPERIHRGKPSGHDGLRENSVSGWFTWRLTLKTPLVYPLDDVPSGQDGTIRYPGSALRGALRNLHESLTGGCLRILDDEYLPVHREPMSVGARSFTLAIVREVDEITGAVTEVEETEDLHWVEEPVIHKVLGANVLCSGCHVDLDTSTARRLYGDRREITEIGAATSGEGWVLHLSSMTSGRDNHYFIAAGRLTGRRRRIPTDAWDQFQRMCEGSQDMIGTADSPDTSAFSPGTAEWPGVEVYHEGGTSLIGRRRRADGHLAKGDTVWLDGRGRLKMATIWRYPGKYTVGERMDEDFLPCHDPNNLCPSCAVFGSVDTRSPRAAGRGANEQVGYATHVRVDWASSDARPTTTMVELPPLRAPKPSSGGFYLVCDPGSGRASRAEDHVPHAHWGSASDKKGSPRGIRGRKYYWHGQTDPKKATTNRQRRRSHQADDGETTIAAAGLVLRARVSFDNLSREQLGWLLAAAFPGSFLDGTCWVHIGRGKPLGYGSAEPGIEDLHVQTAQSRYGPAADDESSTVESLIERARKNTPEELREVHAALRRVLAAQPGGVPADRIWYPTTENFSQQGTEQFDRSFAWFAGHSGGRPSNKFKGDLVPLPQVMEGVQYLPIHVPPEGDGKTQQQNHRNKGGRR